jgi:hypothetical protein
VLISCWSVKGGSGTTVVSAAIALELARRSTERCFLADLCGDLPAALGLPEPDGPGLTDWVAAGPTVRPDAFERMAVDVAASLRLLPQGQAVPQAGDALAAELAMLGTVVVDCGIPRPGTTGWAVTAGADHSLLVIRPCYMALRRALAAPIRPSAVVLVTEPGRALTAADVEDVLGVPVRVEIPCHERIARAVDAGLLAARLPRLLQRALKAAA